MVNVRKAEDILCTIFAIILMIGIEASFMFVIYRPWIANEEMTMHKNALFTIIHVFYCAMWLNYLACSLTPAGDVSDAYKQRFAIDHSSGEINSLAEHNLPPRDRPRWCTVCAAVKPPRAHHCSQCSKCVLKMDHHCPWMGGRCIGLRNHAHFARFCVLVVLCNASWLVAVVQWLIEHYKYGDDRVGAASMDYALIMLVFTTSCSIGILMFVGALAIYHMVSIARNQTTIEAMEEDRLLKQLRGEYLRHYRFPYTLTSTIDNIRVTFGRSWWSWPLPLNVGLPDGYSFDVHPDSLFEGQWPVRLKELEDSESVSFGSAESENYRKSIKRDAEGFLLPQRLFPEFYVHDKKLIHSEPHLLLDDLGDTTRRRNTRSLSPR